MKQYVAEHQLGMESLVLANQATSGEVRKHTKSKSMAGQRNCTGDESLTSRGIIGDLPKAEMKKPVPPSTPVSSTASQNGSSKLSGKFLSSLSQKPAVDENASLGYVVSPPTLSNAISGNLEKHYSPYVVELPAEANPQPTELPAKVPSQAPEKKVENQKQSQPTSSQAVDMLLQMWTLPPPPAATGSKDPKPEEKATNSNYAAPFAEESKANTPPKREPTNGYFSYPYADEPKRYAPQEKNQKPEKVDMRGTSGGPVPDWNSWTNTTSSGDTNKKVPKPTGYTNAYKASVEDEDEYNEPMIDLFPRRAPRPY
jgi:hypothetical protein